MGQGEVGRGADKEPEGSPSGLMSDIECTADRVAGEGSGRPAPACGSAKGCRALLRAAAGEAASRGGQHLTAALRRIISAWSGEPNYFVPGREALPMARRGRWPSGQPLLSIIGTEDRFFGAANSVAAAVREGTAAFGTERLTGSAYKTMTVTCCPPVSARRLEGQ